MQNTRRSARKSHRRYGSGNVAVVALSGRWRTVLLLVFFQARRHWLLLLLLFLMLLRSAAATHCIMKDCVYNHLNEDRPGFFVVCFRPTLLLADVG